MAENNNPLIFLTESPTRLMYTSKGSGGGGLERPPRNRALHSQKLEKELQDAFSLAHSEKQDRAVASLPCTEGVYLRFKSSPNFDLITKSLESTKKNGVRLLTIREFEVNGQKILLATVFVPKGLEQFFLKKISDYAKYDTALGNPKNGLLIESIDEIKLAVTVKESFWQSNENLYPNQTPVWCEAWLRVEKDDNHIDVVKEFEAVCEILSIPLKENQVLKFPERVVVLIQANREQLTELIASIDVIAEFRRAQETADFWMKLSPFEQSVWADDLLKRMQINPSNVSICILDTGVNNGHPLIQPILIDEDCQAWLNDWGTTDHKTHGTLMAGLAIFGNLEKHLSHNLPVIINHRLESVKILPPFGKNDPLFFGAITMDAVSLAEIQAPQRERVIVTAISSAIDSGTGKPSSWSGAVDQIAFGTDDNLFKRLVIIAGGNTDEGHLSNYPDASQATSIESPGQSWNALTVGAYTEKNQLKDPKFNGWMTIAPFGGLSPFSTTSMLWDKKWAIKPDVVFEGGNAAIDETKFVTECDDLSLLSTYSKLLTQSFYTFNKTSAASAQAAWFAAQIMTNYPNIWAETVRSLIVHSASWTDKMYEQFLEGSKREDYRVLLRTCGYGVPNLEKAISCLNNSLTLVVQEFIQPFKKHEKDSRYVANEMHLFELPWPSDMLLNLGEMKVKLRITLSYFIDPSPGEVGWKDKYTYASHGFRFDMNTPFEKKEAFISRINAAVQNDEQDIIAPQSSSQRWKLGKVNRNSGSIHSDYWVGTAADLAVCNLVAVYPTTGWWRGRPHLGKWNSRTRYSLIISLETEDTTIPIYETVTNLIRTKVPIQV
jgi:Subtilase family